MKIHFVSLFLIVALSLLRSRAAEPDWQTWHAERSAKLDALGSLPVESRIPELGEMVRLPYPGRKEGLHELRIDIYNRAQGVLLAIPGHAEYYANRIKDARLEYEKYDDLTPQSSVKKSEAQSRLLREQMWAFQTLQQLPSPETIRVLGEFLTDERGRMVMTPGVYDYFER